MHCGRVWSAPQGQGGPRSLQGVLGSGANPEGVSGPSPSQAVVGGALGDPVPARTPFLSLLIFENLNFIFSYSLRAILFSIRSPS